MKTIFITLAFLISAPAFAGYKCKVTKWNPGPGDTYYMSAAPKYLKLRKHTSEGSFSAITLGKVGTSFGKVEYVLNAEMACMNEQCRLRGYLTEILHPTRNSSGGFLATYRVRIEGEDEQLFPMQEGKFLKVKCK